MENTFLASSGGVHKKAIFLKPSIANGLLHVDSKKGGAPPRGLRIRLFAVLGAKPNPKKRPKKSFKADQSTGIRSLYDLKCEISFPVARLFVCCSFLLASVSVWQPK